jgi:hypothetical protein
MFRRLPSLAAALIASLITLSSAEGEEVYRSVVSVVYADPSPGTLAKFTRAVGPQPKPLADGRFQAIVDFLTENANDPKSIEYIKWSGVGCVFWTPSGDGNMEPYWGVRVKLRGANKVGGMTVSTTVFLIQHGSVVRTFNQSKGGTIDRVFAEQIFPPGSFAGEGPLRQSQLVKDTQKLSDDLHAGLFGGEPEPQQELKPAKRRQNKSKKMYYRQDFNTVKLYNTPDGTIEATIDMSAASGVHAVKLGFDPDDASTLNNPMLTVHYAAGKVTRVLFDDEEVPSALKEVGAVKKAVSKKLRTFVDNTGRHRFEASVVRRDVHHVILEAASKETRKVQLDRLSEPDKKWIDDNYPLDPRILANQQTAETLKAFVEPILNALRKFNPPKENTTVQNQVIAKKAFEQVRQGLERLQDRRFTLMFEIVDVRGGENRIHVRLKPNERARSLLAVDEVVAKYYSDNEQTYGNDGGVQLPLEEIQWDIEDKLIKNAKAGDFVTIIGHPRYKLHGQQLRGNPAGFITLLRMWSSSETFSLFRSGNVNDVTVYFEVDSLRITSMEDARKRFDPKPKAAPLVRPAEAENADAFGLVRVDAGGVEILLDDAPDFIGTPVEEGEADE